MCMIDHWDLPRNDVILLVALFNTVACVDMNRLRTVEWTQMRCFEVLL